MHTPRDAGLPVEAENARDWSLHYVSLNVSIIATVVTEIHTRPPPPDPGHQLSLGQSSHMCSR